MASFNFETHNIKVTSLPGDPSQDGTDATGVVSPTGATGIRGWLRGIYNLFNGGTAKVNATLTGSILTEQKTNADAVANVITFSAPITAIQIIHEELTWQTFIINGLSIKIPQGVYNQSIGGTPSAEVTIPTGITCAVGRLV